MNRSAGWIAATSLALVATVGVVGVRLASQQATCEQPSDIVPAANAQPGKAKQLSAKQTKIAQTIIGVGLNRGIPHRGIKIALMVGRQESGLRNLSFGDLDSLGVFQQRAGWGTARQRLDPVYASNKFYAALVKVKGWQNMPLMEAAIATQRPSRAAYTSQENNFNWWGSMADGLLAGVKTREQSGKQGAVAAMTYDDSCETNSDSGGVSGESGEWVRPLPTMRIGSPYGPRYHPILHYWRLHDGIDLSASSGTSIRSVGNGRIVFRGYNSGAGNHVRVAYPGGITISYLHMSRFADKRAGDNVKTGEVIGYVGSTGLSTAPHLHLGMKKNGKSTNPVPQLCKWKINIAGPKGCSKYAF